MVDSIMEEPIVQVSKSGFEELFEETVMSSVRDLLGESSMRAILYHLSLERLGKDPEEFHQRLYELLNASASIVEEMIIRDLFKRLDMPYSPEGPFDFLRYATAAREFYDLQEKARRE